MKRHPLVFAIALAPLIAACGSDTDTTPSGSGGGGAAGSTSSTTSSASMSAASTTASTAASTAASTGAGGGGGEGGGATGGSGGGSNEVEAFCNGIAGPACDALFACCADAAVLGNYGGTLAACKAAFAPNCTNNLQQDIGPLLANGKSMFDDAQLAACVAKLQALSGGGSACVEPPLWVLQTDCITAFRGQVAAGSACVTTPDDISFVECSHGLCEAGTCAALLTDGEPCVPDTDLCDYTVGLWCNSGAGVCAPRGDIGAPCTPAGDKSIECLSTLCGPGATCVTPGPVEVCSDAG